jgi:hypothetical protein
VLLVPESKRHIARHGLTSGRQSARTRMRQRQDEN